VHAPDYKNLIAFLKAMEFSTLTRRVAEMAEIDASQVEADSKLSSGKALTRPEQESEIAAKATPQKSDDPACCHLSGGEKSNGRVRDADLACGRAGAEGPRHPGRPLQVRNGAGPRAAENLDGRAAVEKGVLRDLDRNGQHRSECRRRCAASRSRWDRTKPATSRSPTASVGTGEGLFATTDSKPNRFARVKAIEAMKPVTGRSRHPQDRSQS
jgi:hypothetical protein